MALRILFFKTLIFILIFIMYFTTLSFTDERNYSGKIFSDDKSSYVKYSGIDRKEFTIIIHTDSYQKNDYIFKENSVFTPIVVWYNNNLVSIEMSDGGSSSSIIFYDLSKRLASKKIYGVVAVNSTNEWILIAQEDVWIQNIFYENKKMILKYDFYNSALKFLIFDEKTQFDKFGNLFLQFMNSKGKGNSTKARIKFDEISHYLN